MNDLMPPNSASAMKVASATGITFARPTGTPGISRRSRDRRSLRSRAIRQLGDGERAVCLLQFFAFTRGQDQAGGRERAAGADRDCAAGRSKAKPLLASCSLVSSLTRRRASPVNAFAWISDAALGQAHAAELEALGLFDGAVLKRQAFEAAAAEIEQRRNPAARPARDRRSGRGR